MKEWTREERYRVLHHADEIKDLYEKIKSSNYRQTYHVEPVTGLSSDPNGFGFHNGTWHLYYQWCPWGAVHGLKYWYHVSSKDLIHWTNEGVGIHPDTIFDNKGAHSGSAFSMGDDLYLFYTGNHRDENWVRTPYTCAAVVKNGKLKKLPKPLFGPRPDYTEHQRDPKILYNPKNETYYIFIGAQNQDLQGRALIYKSKDLLSGWEFAGELKVPGFENFGGMWECPCIVNVSGKDILIFSPQYTKLPGRGESTNHNIYIIGHMDYDTLTFTPEEDYHFLDYGFDFYAAQFAANVQDPDKAILIAWIGLPDNHYPTEEEDWEGSLSLPRELRIKDGKLIQTPLEGIKSLRDGTIEGKLLPRACNIEAAFAPGDADLNLYTREDGTGGMRIHYDEASQSLTVDRSGMEKRFNTNVFETLDFKLDNPLRSMSIYVDNCSIEMFINDGEATFTSRIYPTETEFNFTKTDNVGMTAYKMKASVTDDFVI